MDYGAFNLFWGIWVWCSGHHEQSCHEERAPFPTCANTSVGYVSGHGIGGLKGCVRLLVRCLHLSSQDCLGLLPTLASFPRVSDPRGQDRNWNVFYDWPHNKSDTIISATVIAHAERPSSVWGAEEWGGEDHCGPSWSLTTASCLFVSINMQ